MICREGRCGVNNYRGVILVGSHSQSEGNPHAVLASEHFIDLSCQLLNGNAVYWLKVPAWT